jgi:hypothetical protein
MSCSCMSIFFVGVSYKDKQMRLLFQNIVPIFLSKLYSKEKRTFLQLRVKKCVCFAFS